MKNIGFILLLSLLPLTLMAKVKIISATTDLSYLAEQIGGEFVEVSYIAHPNSDLHYIEIRPSYMIKVAKADIALKVGMELDLWMDKIIDGSRNGDIVLVDCSKYIKPLEVPAFKADARYGDLHRFGNPHYWLTPRNVKPITDAIIEGLTKADAEHEDEFFRNQEKLLNEISETIEELQPKLRKLKGTKIIFYHNSWPYFNEFAGTISAQFIESFPGVAPSPSHVKKLIKLINESDIRLIAMEPYFDKRVPERIARETQAKIVTIYPSIGGRQKNESYDQWLKANIGALIGINHD